MILKMIRFQKQMELFQILLKQISTFEFSTRCKKKKKTKQINIKNHYLIKHKTNSLHRSKNSIWEYNWKIHTFFNKNNMTYRVAGTSLLAKVQSKTHYVVYLVTSTQKIYFVKISTDIGTVNDAIVQSILKLNEQYHLDLKPNIDNYQLYGAKKNGKRKNDLPSIQYEQKLSQTKLTRFNLYPLYKWQKTNQFESKTSQSLKQIRLVMEIGKKKQSKPQISTKEPFGCFCIRM